VPSKKQKTRLAGNQARQTGRIGAVATKSTEQQSTDYLSPSFRFTHADQNKYCLNEWTPQGICQNSEYRLLIAYNSFQARAYRRLDLDSHPALLATVMLFCRTVF